MMPLGADKIITNKHKRVFRQAGGARPNNEIQYSGVEGQYFSITGVSSPVTGGISPINVPHPTRIGQYERVGRSVEPADFPTATIEVMERHGHIPFPLADMSCPQNYYIPTGKCKSLDDFLAGWNDYVEIYSYAEVTDADLGDRTQWDGDEGVMDSLSVTLEAVYAIGKLGFGDNATEQVDREVVAVVYGNNVQCGDCGPADDGTNRLYAVTRPSGAGSPGLPAEVVYTLDGGANWVNINIDGFGANEEPLDIDVVGQKLVVLGADAIFYAELNEGTGAPGAFTKVTTGFVAAGSPTDMFVFSAREVYFSGDGGYIYKATDITSGVSVISAAAATSVNLLRIHGAADGTLVAVGADSVVVKSINRGATWATTTAEPYGIALDVSAVLVLDERRYWVGSASSGRLAYTLNGGETWVEKGFSGSGAGTIRDIVAATDEVIYFSHDTNTPTARIFSSWNGGADFTNASPRIQNLPTFDRGTRLALPYGSHPTIASNNLAVAGLAGNGSDGILLLGVGAIL
jgi:photosystem II stability/assembly factor-like uncharacterized protein